MTESVIKNLEIVQNYLIEKLKIESEKLKTINYSEELYTEEWDSIMHIVNWIHDKVNILTDMKIYLNEEFIINQTVNTNKIISGFVYIAKSLGNNNIYKFGITIDIEHRKRSLKTGNYNIEIIASVFSDYYKTIEQKIHKELKQYKISGEWFKLNDTTLNTIVNKYNFNYHI